MCFSHCCEASTQRALVASKETRQADSDRVDIQTTASGLNWSGGGPKVVVLQN